MGQLHDSGRLYLALLGCSAKGDNNSVLRGLNELLCDKCLEQCLGRSNHYVHIITTTTTIIIIQHLAIGIR